MSTHNLCFGAKLRKIGKPVNQFCYVKIGFRWVYITRTCFRDAYEPLREKVSHLVFDQVRHKPGGTATENLLEA